MNDKPRRRTTDIEHRRSSENGVRSLLPRIKWEIGLAGIVNFIGICTLAAWAWTSDVKDTLAINKNTIAQIVETQQRVVATQAKVVETLSDIKVGLAVLNERDGEHRRRLNAIEGRRSDTQ